MSERKELGKIQRAEFGFGGYDGVGDLETPDHHSRANVTVITRRAATLQEETRVRSKHGNAPIWRH